MKGRYPEKGCPIPCCRSGCRRDPAPMSSVADRLPGSFGAVDAAAAVKTPIRLSGIIHWWWGFWRGVDDEFLCGVFWETLHRAPQRAAG
jgi:hypothetical protein